MTLSDLDRSRSRLVIFRSIISHKRAELGHILLLNVNKKALWRESIGVITFDLVALKDQCQGHSDFEVFYVINEPR